MSRAQVVACAGSDLSRRNPKIVLRWDKSMEFAPLDLTKLVPAVLWFLFVVGVVCLFYRPIRQELLPRLSGLNFMGVEFSFVEASIDAAIELAKKSPQWKVDISPEEKERAIARAKRHVGLFKGASFLWVDDHPENNLNERKMFRQLGAEIDIARSSDEALEMLGSDAYDIVMSDMDRNGNATAGLEFLSDFRKVSRTTPVIFYIGVVDPAKGTPARAFGITNRPDELLHLTLDCLERKKH